MPPTDPLKINIDPVFKGKKPADSSPAGGVYNVLNNQKYTPSAQPTAPLKELAKDKTYSPKSIVRTYKSDMESAIAADHLSSINIAVAENQKMHSQLKEETPAVKPPSKYSASKVLIFISFILIVAGVVGISVAYIFTRQNSSPAARLQELPSLITTEYKDEINLDALAKGHFISTLSGKLNGIGVPVNNLYNTYITTGTSSTRRLVTAEEFITVAGFSMPDIVKRTLLPDYMIGMYAYGKNLPFLILKTSYFDNAYAGMLQWEKDLEEDFKIIFQLPGSLSTGGLISDLTPTEARVFEDAVIVNKDVRLIRDQSGEIILLYGIIDKETIVITVNDTAFKEIINRLNKEKGLRR